MFCHAYVYHPDFCLFLFLFFILREILNKHRFCFFYNSTALSIVNGRNDRIVIVVEWKKEKRPDFLDSDQSDSEEYFVDTSFELYNL